MAIMALGDMWDHQQGGEAGHVADGCSGYELQHFA